VGTGNFFVTAEKGSLQFSIRNKCGRARNKDAEGDVSEEGGRHKVNPGRILAFQHGTRTEGSTGLH